MLCVVTGASRGIGRAIAEELIAAGAEVAVCAFREAPDVAGAVLSARCDVADERQVQHFFAQAGRPEDGTDPKPINMAEFFVDLKPPAEWPAGLTREKLIQQFGKQLDALPGGVEPSFSQPIRDNVLESISQIDGQIVIKVFGPDGDVLQAQTQKVLQTISPVRGVGLDGVSISPKQQAGSRATARRRAAPRRPDHSTIRITLSRA